MKKGKQSGRRPGWRRRTHRVWSIKTITIVAAIAISLTAANVYFFGKRSLFFETELTLSLIAAGLFLFLSVGLYRGMRLRRSDLPGTEVDTVAADKAIDAMDPLSHSLEVAGSADDPLSGLVGFVLAFIALLVFGVLLWGILSIGIALWVYLLAAVAWTFHWALRQVFAKSRVCRGRVAPSVGYALYYTMLYTGWLFALVWIASGVFGSKLRDG